jgi:hypothetical protein
MTAPQPPGPIARQTRNRCSIGKVFARAPRSDGIAAPLDQQHPAVDVELDTVDEATGI